MSGITIGSPEEFVDMVAQAVIDRIEHRDRVNALVEKVVKRVIELQQEQANQGITPQSSGCQ